MKKGIKILILLLLLAVLFFPLISFAGGSYTADGTTTVNYKGFVPCGKSKPVEGESKYVTMSCQFGHIFIMFKGIIDFVLIDLVPPIAVLMIIICGIMIYGGGANPGLVAKARATLFNVMIGLFIIYGAYFLVGVVLNITGAGGWEPFKNWASQGAFTIQFNIKLPY